MPRNIREFLMYGSKIENSWRKVRVTTKKLAKTQPPSSKFFCSKCFTGLLIPLADNQRVHFEEEESNKLFRTKMFLLWFLQVLSNSVWNLAILDALQYASYFL